MRSVVFTILLLSVVTVSAQSGRVKPEATPTPKPMIGPSVRTIPSNESTTNSRPRTAPTPISANDKGSDDDDVIKVDSTLVPIPVSVLDANGRQISDLKVSDFILKINDIEVEIGDISRSETPVRLAMLFDNSSSVLAAREFEINAAIKFFRRVLRPDRDMAALYTVSTVTRLEQPFTKNISSLIRSIEFFPKPEGATALLEGLVMAAKDISITDGRRVIVIVSDGDDTKSDVTFEQTLKAIQIANTQVYVVQTNDFENYIRTKSRKGNANIRQLAAERRMLELTRNTGGAVYSPIDEKELDEAFRQISAELAQQYVLNYYPEDSSAASGEMNKIEVAVRGRSDLTVRARKGYYVTKR